MLAFVFEGFELHRLDVADGVRLRVRIGGAGFPVVLLHGHPRTHATWYQLAPRLVAAGFAVVCPDLRGYGRSTAPAPLPDHAQASKRAMAGDVVALMDQLGHERFAVAGHGRGSYPPSRPPRVSPPGRPGSPSSIPFRSVRRWPAPTLPSRRRGGTGSSWPSRKSPNASSTPTPKRGTGAARSDSTRWGPRTTRTISTRSTTRPSCWA